MNKKGLLILIGSICLILIFAILPFMAACAPAPPEVIVLKAVRPFPYDNVLSIAYRALVERVNQRMAGRLVIEDIGGKEVYPPWEQLEPVAEGVVDLVNAPSSYHLGTFPEGNVTDITFGATAPELRAGGLIQALDRMARESIGVAILGAPSFWLFHILTIEPFETLEDLKGMKLRVSPTYLPIMEGLGVPTVTMPAGELYTALQTGVVDGFAWSHIGMVDFGLHELVKYQLFPPILMISQDLLYMNAARLDALPDDIREDFLDIVTELEADAYDMFINAGAEEIKVLRQAGVQPIVMSDEEWFYIQELQWKGASANLRKLAPKNAEELIGIASQWYPPKQVYQMPYEWR